MLTGKEAVFPGVPGIFGVEISESLRPPPMYSSSRVSASLRLLKWSSSSGKVTSVLNAQSVIEMNLR